MVACTLHHGVRASAVGIQCFACMQMLGTKLSKVPELSDLWKYSKKQKKKIIALRAKEQPVISLEDTSAKLESTRSVRGESIELSPMESTREGQIG